MMSNDVINNVRTFIVNNFLFGEDGQLQDDTSFLESGIIDSTGILELVTYIEENYEIQIQGDELVPENLDSLQNVAAFIDKKVTCVE